MFRCILFQILIIPFSSCDFGLFMPNALTDREIILCHGVKIVNEVFITGFDPMIEQASHILIYTCFVPGSYNRTWECESTNKISDQPLRDICGDSRKNILFSWAHNGTSLRLPKDVSFRVGGHDGPNYFVINAHYHGPIVTPDSSGIWLKTTINSTPNSAGVFLLQVTDATVPIGGSNTSIACLYTNKISLHPFAFRVHTHEHGVIVSGYRLRSESNLLIGQRDPKLPQIFESTKTKITIKKNDIIKSVCMMNNEENKNYTIGLSHHNEMCLFYLMYWVKGTKLPSLGSCTTSQQIDRINGYKFHEKYSNFFSENNKDLLFNKKFTFFNLFDKQNFN